MVQFLSDDYMQEATSALRTHDGFMSAIQGVDLDLQFTVTGAPGGDDIDYRISIANNDVELTRSTSDNPDVTVTNSYETAVGISRGELNTQMAFMTGKIKVAGNMAMLMRHQGLVNHVASALADLDVDY